MSGVKNKVIKPGSEGGNDNIKQANEYKLILIKSNTSGIQGKDIKGMNNTDLATHLYTIGLPDTWCLEFYNSNITGDTWLNMKPEWLFVVGNKALTGDTWPNIEKMNKSIDEYNKKQALELLKIKKEKIGKPGKSGGKTGKPGKHGGKTGKKDKTGGKTSGKTRKKDNKTRRKSISIDIESDKENDTWNFDQDTDTSVDDYIPKKRVLLEKKDKKTYAKINWNYGAIHMFRDLKDKTCGKINWKEVETNYEKWVKSLKKRDKNIVKRFVFLYIYFQYLYIYFEYLYILFYNIGYLKWPWYIVLNVVKHVFVFKSGPPNI